MQPFRICCWAWATKTGHDMLYQTTKKSLDNVQNRRKVNINNETYRYSKLNNCSPTTITLYWRNLNYIIVYNNRQTSNYKWYGFFFLFLLFRLFSFLFCVWIKRESEGENKGKMRLYLKCFLSFSYCSPNNNQRKRNEKGCLFTQQIGSVARYYSRMS